MMYRLVAAVSLMIVSTCAAASTCDYVGIEYKYRKMKGSFTDTYSLRNILPQHYDSVEIYAAHRFDNNVGISVGFEQSRATSVTHVFTAGEGFFGDPQQAGDVSVFDTKLREIQVDVVGYYNFTDNFEGVGQLGLAFFQADMQATLTYPGARANLNPSDNYEVIPRVGFGLQYFIFKNIGIRGMLTWEGTETYRMKITDEDGVRIKIKPFKESWTAAIGIVVRFG